MRTSICSTAVALLACLTVIPSAYAATTTTTFNVTATVPTSCSVTTGGALAFGPYAGAQIDQTTTVSVTCTSGGAYTVGLDDGLNYSAPNRRMGNGGGAYLTYELYSDALRTTRWGNAVGSWVSDTGNGLAQSKTVYGRLASGQTLIAGAYTDTITVTVTYTP